MLGGSGAPLLSLSTIEAAVIVGQVRQRLFNTHWDSFLLGFFGLR
jgi:hypothetical protein